MRIGPPVSEPSAPKHNPAASAAPDPPLATEALLGRVLEQEIRVDGDAVAANADAGRVEVILAPSNPQVLYASVTNMNPSPGNLLGFYKSGDGGKNWAPLNGTPDYCQPQCWYNNVLAVDPTTPDVIYAGGVGLYRSTDGGVSWSSASNGLHVDHHALAYDKNGTRLYDGNDGGMWSTTTPRAASVARPRQTSTGSTSTPSLIPRLDKFLRSSATERRCFSKNTTCRAPRLSASMPTAPVPA